MTPNFLLRRALRLLPRGGAPSVPAAIYGASWDKGSSPALTRIDDAVGMVANAGVDMTPATNDFDSAQVFGEFSTVTDGYGNVFIRIPKCYLGYEDTGAALNWRISKAPFVGSYLPWCFWDFTSGAELPYVDVGAHKASFDGSNRMESKPGMSPAHTFNIVTARTRAQANGTGYQQLDVHVYDLLQTLFIIEFATLNSQSVMQGFTTGQISAEHTATVMEVATNRIIVANATAAQFLVGQTISVHTAAWNAAVFSGRLITAIAPYDGANMAISFGGAPVNIAVGNILTNTGWVNGFSSSIAASSGSLVSNSTGKWPMKYRGIESLYGDMWQFVDGVNINERQAWVCRDAANYTSNLFTAPYEQLSYVNHGADGWVTAMGRDSDRLYAKLPAAAGGSPSTYYSDYYYQSAGQRIALVGGGWYYGGYAGVSYWYLNNTSGAAVISLGARLVRKSV